MSDKHFKNKREMYMALGVYAGTLDRWLLEKWFPKKGRYGWTKATVIKAVEKYNNKKLESTTATGKGDRADKIRLECEKLRVMIAQEKSRLLLIEFDTAEREGKLAEVKDLETHYSKRAQASRGIIDNWRDHNTAKYPKLGDQIDGMCDELIDSMRAVYEGE